MPRASMGMNTITKYEMRKRKNNRLIFFWRSILKFLLSVPEAACAKSTRVVFLLWHKARHEVNCIEEKENMQKLPHMLLNFRRLRNYSAVLYADRNKGGNRREKSNKKIEERLADLSATAARRVVSVFIPLPSHLWSTDCL